MNPLPLASTCKASCSSATFASIAVLAAILTSSCSNAPKTPDWHIEAKGAMDRSVAAYLGGNTRVALAELGRARQQLSSTGRADLMASAELLHCATQAASLVLEPCAGFEALRGDATDAQRAYADYLRGHIEPSQIPLLPAAQAAAAARAAAEDASLRGMDDALSRLVAASVMLQTGKASPAIIDQAVDTASNQGWRRPLLAWLGVQAQQAKHAGLVAQEAHIRRRIARVLGEPPAPK